MHMQLHIGELHPYTGASKVAAAVGSSAPAVPKPSEAQDAARDGDHIARGSSSPFGSSYEGFNLQTGPGFLQHYNVHSTDSQAVALAQCAESTVCAQTAAAKVEAKTPEVLKLSEAKDAVENGEHGAWSV